MATESNKDFVRAFVEAWNTKDLDRFDELLAQDAQLTVGEAAISCSPIRGGPGSATLASRP